jgi:hypothetical protein
MVTSVGFFPLRKRSRSENRKLFILSDVIVVISVQFNGCHMQKSVTDSQAETKFTASLYFKSPL